MGFACDCIQLNIDDGVTITQAEIFAEGELNGQAYWEYTYESVLFYLFWDTDRWYLNDVLGSTVDWYAQLEVAGCPFGIFATDPRLGVGLEIKPCDSCAPKQERIEEFFSSVKLPEVFEEQNRGFFRCCCPFNVLASAGPTWENDITSAWIKLSSGSDTTSAVLLKNGQPTAYTPTIQAFPNDVNAYYWTINWNDVLLSDGVGCYSLRINYNISGVQGNFTWGIYNLLPFTIQNALKTARLRVKFNSYQEIEGINFTGANVEDTIRFFGFIGYRQPNMEIDNLIYKNREVKKVKRENLNTYEVITDPTCEEHIKKLTDLYLLSENELYISDYNAHNHSYRYQDLPAVVEESPELTYFDFARSASLKCIVGDKKKDKRSFYNGGLGFLGGGNGGGGTVCLPASYIVEYATAGPIQSGTIPSGGSETIVVPDPGVCADGTVENSNATYTDSVPSGGTLVLPDITVTDSDGSTYTQPSVDNVVCTAQIKDLFWELNYNGTDDVIYIPATASNVGTLTSGTGSNVGTITVSTDNVTFVSLTFPFTPVNGTTYYFKRSTATVNGTYTMTGTYA